MIRLIKDRFGKWYKDTQFNSMAHIFEPAFSTGVFSEKFLIEKGVIAKIEEFKGEPSVVDYLKFGMKVDAVLRYYHIHNCSLKEAREIVDKIQEDLENMKNGE